VCVCGVLLGLWGRRQDRICGHFAPSYTHVHDTVTASMGVNGRACERFVRSKAQETDLAEVGACVYVCVRACVRAYVRHIRYRGQVWDRHDCWLSFFLGGVVARFTLLPCLALRCLAVSYRSNNQSNQPTTQVMMGFYNNDVNALFA
jgi:hypothetical protein